MKKPFGVTFKFLVESEITGDHKKRLIYGIAKTSGLRDYFKIGDIKFCPNFKDKQMMVKVWCPEPTVAVSDEDKFYEEIKGKFSEWIIGTLKDNNYRCKLYDFSLSVKII